MRALGFDNLKGNDLVTDTNGLQNEGFDQQAGTSDLSWQVNDRVTMKYIFGYSSFFYDRNTDVDLTSSHVFDNQFYVSQEAEYVSHELQAFTDVSDALSITTGLFYYDSKITQRGDFYDSLCKLNQPCSSRYANAFPYAAAAAGGRADCRVHRDAAADATAHGEVLRSASTRRQCRAGQLCSGSVRSGVVELLLRQLAGQHQQPRRASEPVRFRDGSAVPDAVGAQLVSRRTTQGVYTFNPHWALTLGVRWARDQLTGEENLDYYTENSIAPAALGFPAAGGASSLAR